MIVINYDESYGDAKTVGSLFGVIEINPSAYVLFVLLSPQDLYNCIS